MKVPCAYCEICGEYHDLGNCFPVPRPVDAENKRTGSPPIAIGVSRSAEVSKVREGKTLEADTALHLNVILAAGEINQVQEMTEIKSLPIIVPFALGSQHLTPVRIALQHEHREPRYAYLENDTSYHDLLWKLWDTGEAFILNEHDIIAWPGAISKLEECESPWCTFLYRCEAGWLKRGLGLVKFDPSRLPNIFEKPFSDTHWRCLDTQIAGRLERMGFSPCNHKPAVTNLNPFVWGAAVPHTTESMSYP